MEKDRSSKIMAVLAMLIAIVGLSLGFAAFTRTLTIESKATVNTDSTTFSVKLSNSENSLDESEVTPTTSPSISGPQGSAATIENGGDTPTISNLKATFTNPGQEVVYTFYAVNDGQFDAYLKEITFGNASMEGGTVECTAEDTTSADMVAEACKGIKMTVTVDSAPVASTTIENNSPQPTISGFSIAKSADKGLTLSSHKVEVKLAYLAESAVADGKFSVKFGNVSLKYKSTDN